MKKSVLSLVLMIAFMSVCFSQIQISSVTVHGRAVGLGTHITVPMTAYTSNLLRGFDLKITRGGKINPESFEPGYLFRDWTLESFPSSSTFNVTAVGNPISSLSDFKLGRVGLFISDTSDMPGGDQFVSFSFFDGKSYWETYCKPFKVKNLPAKAYGDMNKDGKLDVVDGIIMWDMLGLAYDMTNDTARIISDLSGDGFLSSWDLRLLLGRIVNQDYYWPIFPNTSRGGGGTTPFHPSGPVEMNWKQLPDGKWGLYSQESVTNGDLVAKNSHAVSGNGNGMFKRIDDKIFFVNQSVSTSSPILIADTPVALSGTVNEGRNIVVSSTVTEMEKEEAVPTSFSLEQNYPNPFNPSTTISFSLPTAGFVILKIYDALGREVKMLVNEQKSAGSYSIKFDAMNLPSGVYIYKLSAAGFSQTRKMILNK